MMGTILVQSRERGCRTWGRGRDVQAWWRNRLQPLAFFRSALSQQPRRKRPPKWEACVSVGFGSAVHEFTDAGWYLADAWFIPLRYWYYAGVVPLWYCCDVVGRAFGSGRRRRRVLVFLSYRCGCKWGLRRSWRLSVTVALHRYHSQPRELASARGSVAENTIQVLKGHLDVILTLIW